MTAIVGIAGIEMIGTVEIGITGIMASIGAGILATTMVGAAITNGAG